jgi:hypothetical protein
LDVFDLKRFDGFFLELARSLELNYGDEASPYFSFVLKLSF